MAAWRYEISLRVFKNISMYLCIHISLNKTTEISTVVCSFYTRSFVYELLVSLLTISVKTRKDVFAQPANVNVDLFLSIW